MSVFGSSVGGPLQLIQNSKQILRGRKHYADAATVEIATEIVAMEQRALEAESLLSSMIKGSELMEEAIGAAAETFGFLHACMFGAERHLREHGWLKPDVCNCQAPPTHMSNDCPVHGLDDERPFR